jgi:hypothetical protein
MERTIEIAGDVVERQELLNGTQTITIEGVDPAAEWTLTGSLSWNLGLVDYVGEGDLTLTRADGAELFATLTHARVAEADADAAHDHTFDAMYEIDGGSGAFERATGDAHAVGALAGDRFRGTWTVRLAAP